MSRISGLRSIIEIGSEEYPKSLELVENPPERLYVVGDPSSMTEGLAIVGARKATPYGISAAGHFADLASRCGITVISGGARGCDAASHRAAIEAEGKTIAFLGGGCDEIYPPEHEGLFNDIVESGGCLISEHEWSAPPLPHQFRLRNRLIAGLSKATLIVEAGLPSGTFTTADYALSANREVLVIPGAISSRNSRGANKLIYQGATPIIDDETFSDQMSSIFGKTIKRDPEQQEQKLGKLDRVLLSAIKAEPKNLDELFELVAKNSKGKTIQWLMIWLANKQSEKQIAKYPNGRYGPIVS